MLRLAFESVGAVVLFATAFVALADSRRDLTRFSLVAGFGTLLLAFDEALDLHESAGRELYGWLDGREPPLVNHWDDLIVMGIGLAGLMVAAWFRDEIIQSRPFALRFATGLVVFALAIAWDSAASTEGTRSWWTEETLELVAGSLMLWAFTWRLRARAVTTVAGSPATLSVAAIEGEP